MSRRIPLKIRMRQISAPDHKAGEGMCGAALAEERRSHKTNQDKGTAQKRAYKVGRSSGDV